MANGHCRECRFFDGKRCSIRNASASPGSSCGNFADNTGGSDDKHCRACRFYDGKKCSVRNASASPGSSCGNWAAFRA